MSGDPNCGKTNLALAICAAVTTGEPLPWELERGKVEPQSCLFQSMEDGYGDTIKPRLLRLGADCDRVHVINERIEAAACGPLAHVANRHPKSRGGGSFVS
jgi:hypothetical protein